MRAVKLLVGVLLLPLCYAATRALADLALAIKPEAWTQVSFGAWSLAGGFGFWLFFWRAMPKPVRTYVLGHELTHALWGVLLGARVSRLRVSARGGSVRLSKTNFLITLAPYFFPFYTVLVSIAYGALSLFFDLRAYQPFWLALVGLTWGFHVTFTAAALAQRQTDIEDHGVLFSYAVIFLLNVLGLCLWIVIVASPTLHDLDLALRSHLGGAGARLVEWARAGVQWLAAR